MDRRRFLRYSGAAVTSSLLLPSGLAQAFTASKQEYKLGYQLYSVNKDMQRSPWSTLLALKDMGYRDFEVFGFEPDSVSYYGLSAKDFKRTLDELGLTASSGHYGFAPYLAKSQAEMDAFVAQCLKGAKKLETPFITWPWMAPEQRTLDTFKRLPDILNRIGEQVSKAGLQFAYHNHGFEFEIVDPHTGQSGYDMVLNQTDPDLVKMQMDMYWVSHAAKTTPKALVEKYPGRFVMWHIKDMDKVSRDYTELGNGSIDYPSVLPNPSESGLRYYYIEQGGNFASSPLESAAASAAYFKAHLASHF
ncbi:TIM barrel protein [Aestuariibacter sp. GS-14]|uniref:sugar phosphate isomerase/epimerase family protein n=1 Tax=Aestuariibacter sp. GS-14 TaxID=2590670 RepID=UPI00112C2DC1|nr:TIM barrel protein [Aestuariibacter sp. GS-14]TPV58393.1 TIM barrel protein [Aestuariibacter sp. GS-14]